MYVALSFVQKNKQLVSLMKIIAWTPSPKLELGKLNTIVVSKDVLMLINLKPITNAGLLANKLLHSVVMDFILQLEDVMKVFVTYLADLSLNSWVFCCFHYCSLLE
jgi:hypothetical protein